MNSSTSDNSGLLPGNTCFIHQEVHGSKISPVLHESLLKFYTIKSGTSQHYRLPFQPVKQMFPINRTLDVTKL